MATHPGQLLLSLLLGLIAASALVGALYLLVPRRRTVPVVRESTSTASGAPRPTVAAVGTRRRSTLAAALAVVLLLLVFAGKYVVGAFFPNGSAPLADRTDGTVSKVRGASGAELTVVRYGPNDGPALVFTHGWGADRRDWSYAISALPADVPVVVWDLPGLGESAPTASGDYSMEAMAADLDSVVSSLQGRPAILVGHSIGGMLNLEYARRYPQKLGREVRGLVQVNTTYTNPVETKKNAELSRKLQKPVFEPLLHVVDWTSPVARILGWFAYQSGLAHLQLARQSFAGAETWDQLDQMARYAYRSSPRVVARGVIAMLHWDGSNVLPKIGVPTLIISGNEDVTTLPVASDRMEQDIRASSRVSVDRAAHLGPVEQYRKYAAAIAQFAGRASGASVGPVAAAGK
jgi:pimeloyl-ACP methyl ester carboxylesterase